MTSFTKVAALALGLAFASSAFAQAPSDAPTGSTGLCKDGSYTSGANKRSACRGHKGVKDWYVAADAAAAPAATTAKTAADTPAEPAGPAPAGSTGLCKDGSYTSGANKRSACRGHKGVKDWYATTETAAPATNGAPAATAAAAAPPPMAAAPKKTTPEPLATAAAGGGAGQVWVNTKSKVYHCEGDRWYGKTKSGEYMTEAAAKAAGNHADAGKACS